MINRCCTYLNIFTIHDLLLLDQVEIHPDYIRGIHFPSHISYIIWPQYPRPPKKYWGLWTKFLSDHITPILLAATRDGYINANHRAYTTYFKHRRTPHLYKYCDNSLCQFSLNYRWRATKKTIRYQNIPYISDLSWNVNDFFPVDIQHTNEGIQVLGRYVSQRPQRDVNTFDRSQTSVRFSATGSTIYLWHS
jgi:hypothetical protein